MNFNSRIIRIGTITVSIALIANFLPGLYIWAAYGEIPPVSDLFTLWLTVAAAQGVSWFIQPLSYFGSLGTAGTYIAWVAGSAADIRLPAVSMAHKVTNLEPNTPKGDVMATLALATSVFVSVSMITIFALIGTSVIPMMPPVVKTGFSYILPALFAAVYTNMALKAHTQGILILIGCVVLMLILPMIGIPRGLHMLICIIGGVIISKFMHQASSKK